DDAATVRESPCGFLQGEEDDLGVGTENPVVLLLGAFRQGFDDYIGRVGDDDVQLTLSRCRNAPSPRVINVKLRRIPREKQNTKQNYEYSGVLPVSKK